MSKIMIMALAVVVLGFGGLPLGEGEGWRYVVPGVGDSFEHAPFRAIVLSAEKLPELVEKVAYRGEAERRRYAILRFGSASSTRVSAVVDRVANGDVDLYVDADRNLRIDGRDKVGDVPGGDSRSARIWRVPLGVAVVDGETVSLIPRNVVFRLGASGQTLAFATQGYLEGTAVLGDKDRGRRLLARRVDGDGNGFMTDAQDAVFLDLNGDGQLDQAREQFLFATILNVEGKRYVVKSDELGTRLALEPLEGTGTIRLALSGKGATVGGKVVEMRATAIGRDGSVYALDGNAPAIVPEGEYRLANVNIALRDEKSGEIWTFVFSDGLGSEAKTWHRVEKSSTVEIDPIGKLRFELRRFDENALARPGDDIRIRPALYTGEGLLIVVAYCGKPIAPATQELLGSKIILKNGDGQHLATANSGFS